ncbi:hypothetical protein F444_20156 [Phytophthora nicotianae P1976]|uniref:HAT C-terminal dimerisation domain-containing protein n=1 Tax=Phytophthora nicotianae P1976 TaxID=1317066 RepID=A0A080Z5H1_PHYNI|nr:hypothetical protein F444_20156 [Phytophthora nicotianae P1976]
MPLTDCYEMTVRLMMSFCRIITSFGSQPRCFCVVMSLCVEHRWMQCEQPLFLLGYALHPVYAEDARSLPNTAGSLPKVAVYYFRRLFHTEEMGTIKRDMFSWMENRFTRTRPSEFDNCPWEYWEYIAKKNPKSKLLMLAMRVLSIVVNTVTCERLFSEHGIMLRKGIAWHPTKRSIFRL